MDIVCLVLMKPIVLATCAGKTCRTSRCVRHKIFNGRVVHVNSNYHKNKEDVHSTSTEFVVTVQFRSAPRNVELSI